MRKYYSRLIISLLTVLFGMRAALLPFALLKTQVASAATDYYVATTGSDSNPGTQSQPFKTIRKGSQVATAGTTVHVAAGTYTETIRTTQSGTASSRIRFVSYVKWAAKIIPPANSTREHVWDIRGNYVDINGFEVDGSNCTSCTVGIYMGGSYDRVINTHVHNIANNIPCLSHGAAGIVADHYYGGVHNNVIGNVVDHIGVDQCNFYHGIYMSTSGIVKNNIVNNVSAYGIHLWHDATNVTVVNNTVFNNGSAGSDGGGIVIGSGDYYNFSGPGDYNIVANNIVYNNLGWGIVEAGNTGTHNTYTNNLVYGNITNWGLQNGLTHTNTITADPRFVNYLADGTGNYHLAADSPAIDKGINASYVPTTDFDGTIRPRGAAPDIGAYEYGGGDTTPPGSPTDTLSLVH